MNHRGFIGDALTIILTGFTVCVVVLILVLLVHTVRSSFTSSSTIPTEAKDIITNGDDQYPGSMDFFLITMLFGLPMVAACFAYFLDVSSIFLWIMILLMFIFVIVGAVFANLWNAIINSPSFSTIPAQIPMTSYVMNNYALYALYVTLVIMGGMFFRLRGNA